VEWCGVVGGGVVWCGVVWCGVVWCGVVWCGVVWCGVVSVKVVRVLLCSGVTMTLYKNARTPRSSCAAAEQPLRERYANAAKMLRKR
jgi:hypothetical protein